MCAQQKNLLIGLKWKKKEGRESEKSVCDDEGLSVRFLSDCVLRVRARAFFCKWSACVMMVVGDRRRGG